MVLTPTVAVENVFFKPMQFLYDLINQYIPDVNSTRVADLNPKAKQWIFPEVPEANDEFYPRIALIPGNLRIEEYGAGRYIETVTDIDGNWQSETRGVIAILPITIGIFVKKKQMWQVELIDKTLEDMQNKKLADFLGYQISQLLIVHRPDFIAKNMDIIDMEVSGSYEDGQFWYAKDITFTLWMWMANSTIFDPASLIKNIDLSIQFVQGLTTLLTEIVAHYAFDSSSPPFLNDVTQEIDLINQGSTETTGILGEARHTDGIDQSIAMTMDLTDVFDGAFSMNLWFKTTWTVANALFGWYGGGGAGDYVEFVLNYDAYGNEIPDSLEIEWSSGGIFVCSSIGAVFADDNWHMLTITKANNDVNTIKMYFDGEAKSLIQRIAGPSVIPFFTHLPWWFGARNLPVSPSYNAASFDELAFWHRELTLKEIQSLYNLGNAIPFNKYGEVPLPVPTPVLYSSLIFTDDVGIPAGGETRKSGQKIIIADNISIHCAEIFVTFIYNPTAEYIVRIETDNAGEPSGILVDANAIKNVPYDSLVMGNWNAFSFDNHFTLPPGTYWLVVTSEETMVDHYILMGGRTGVTPNGNWVYDDGPGRTWQHYLDVDMGYKLYAVVI